MMNDDDLIANLQLLSQDLEKSLFPNQQGEQPTASEIVIRDGFDQLEREDAIAFYAGKSWQEVLVHLRGLKNEPIFTATYFLEEWSVLSPKALTYYLRGHLEFLLETLAATQPDEEYISQLFYELCQVIYMHNGNPFTAHQTILLKQVAQITSDRTSEEGACPYYDHDIESQIAQFLSLLERCDM